MLSIERKREIKKRAKAKRRKENFEYANKIKAIGCSLCEEKSIACMEFHHLDKSSKDYKITVLLKDGYPIETVKQEIAKCSVICSNCHRKIHKDDKTITTQYKRLNIRKNRNKEYITRIKLENGCKLCGNKDLYCLDFHHRDSTEKLSGVGRCVPECWSIQRIDIEIAKCDILCSNCHKKHHG